MACVVVVLVCVVVVVVSMLDEGSCVVVGCGVCVDEASVVVS